jgi:hypothetical protein
MYLTSLFQLHILFSIRVLYVVFCVHTGLIYDEPLPKHTLLPEDESRSSSMNVVFFPLLEY